MLETELDIGDFDLSVREFFFLVVGFLEDSVCVLTESIVRLEKGCVCILVLFCECGNYCFLIFSVFFCISAL